MEERRLSAIMFTDIVGYTAMMGADEQATIELVKKARELQKKWISEFRGELIEESGDAILACFSSASDSVYCAIEIIRRSAEITRLNLHIGIHLGEVVFSEGKLYGDGVNISARINAAAKSGEVLVSEDIWKNIKNKTEIKAGYIGKRNFKNVTHPVRIYRISTGLNKPLPIPFLHGLSNLYRKSKLLFITFSLIFLSLLVFVIVNRIELLPFKDHEPDKSVVVLPFHNDSPDNENEYFCNGVMEQIILQLQRMGDLKVPSRTSVEPYRLTSKSPKVIARELGVTNILEGSVQRSGNRVKVNVKLLRVKDDFPLWFDTFEEEVEDVFNVQNEIAIQVAYVLNATLSDQQPHALPRKKITSMNAYDLYLQAREEHLGSEREKNLAKLEHSIQLYKKAIKTDSMYADAYTGLALAYWNKNYYYSYLNEFFLDTVKFLVEKSLSIDKNLEEAYWLRSQYQFEKGNFGQAVQEINKALEINPNYSQALWFKGILKIWYQKDLAGGLKILHQVVRYEHGNTRISMLRNLGYIYFQAGLYDLSEYYYLAYAELSGDSSQYYYYRVERLKVEKQLDLAFETTHKICPAHPPCLDYLYQTGSLNLLTGNFKAALENFSRYDSLNDFPLNHKHRLGYLYSETGNRQKAEILFNEQIIISKEAIKLNRWYASVFREAYYDLAGIYIYNGEKDIGLDYLREFGSQRFVPAWMIDQMKEDPLFLNVHDHRIYQSILENLTEMNEREMERIRVMLRDEDLLI